MGCSPGTIKDEESIIYPSDFEVAARLRTEDRTGQVTGQEQQQDVPAGSLAMRNFGTCIASLQLWYQCHGTSTQGPSTELDMGHLSGPKADIHKNFQSLELLFSNHDFIYGSNKIVVL